MIKKSKSRHRLTAVIAMLCCLSMLTSVFAFFTDRVTEKTFGQAGNIDLMFLDISSSKTGDNGIHSNNEFAIDQAWENTSLVSSNAIINPGDYFDLSYSLRNLGSKSMDVRQQLTLISTVPLTADAEEYKLIISGKNYNTTPVVGKISDDKFSIVYELEDIVLNGSIETEDDVTWDTETYTVRLNFDLMASNKFMNSGVEVSYKAQAKQHRNTTEDDWATWLEYETRFEEIFTYPMLAASDTWYTGSTKRSTITAINIVDSADEATIASATESWPAAADADGDGTLDDDIMCYVNGTTLTIAGDGSGSVLMNPDSSSAFSDHNLNDCFANVTTFSNTNLLDTSKVVNFSSMFNGCQSLTTLDVSDWNTSKVTDMNRMFYKCQSLTTIDVSDWNTSKVTDMSIMFYNCFRLTSLDLSNWDTSNVTTMKAMFAGESDTVLTSIGDISGWDTSNVTTMQAMFQECASLTSLDVSNFDTSKVTNMGFMFYGCDKLGTLDLTNFDTSNVESFDHMFKTYITLAGGKDAVKNWDTSSATNMNAMFYGIANKVLDLSHFDTSNVTVFAQMFENSHLETIIGLENWDTSNGISFQEMFWNAARIKELDLSSFDTRKAKNGIVISYNGNKSTTMKRFFGGPTGNINLRKIVLGENFSFNGDGTNTNADNKFVMPAPGTNVSSTGIWYREDGVEFAPADVPEKTAGTYYAVKQ